MWPQRVHSLHCPKHEIKSFFHSKTIKEHLSLNCFPAEVSSLFLLLSQMTWWSDCLGLNPAERWKFRSSERVCRHDLCCSWKQHKVESAKVSLFKSCTDCHYSFEVLTLGFFFSGLKIWYFSSFDFETLSHSYLWHVMHFYTLKYFRVPLSNYLSVYCINIFSNTLLWILLLILLYYFVCSYHI